MKTEIMHVNLLAPRWWNPLSWLVVVLAPVFGIVAGTICGALNGLLIGYEKGLEIARNKLHKIIVELS